jgi:hypothetical protein
VVEKTGHVHEVARGQDVDDPVMLDVGDGRGVAGVMAAELHEARLIEADRARFVEALAVLFEQRLAVGGDGVVDGVPVTAELPPPPSRCDRSRLGPSPTWPPSS